jgi:putative solute:sodium symporter small subunit
MHRARNPALSFQFANIAQIDKYDPGFVNTVIDLLRSERLNLSLGAFDQRFESRRWFHDLLPMFDTGQFYPLFAAWCLPPRCYYLPVGTGSKTTRLHDLHDPAVHAALERYWRNNVRIMIVLLLFWAGISFGCGILFVDWLNQFRLPGTGFPLGFWIAQQGSIIVFVLCILIYCLAMNWLDRRHHDELKSLEPKSIEPKSIEHRVADRR